MIKKTLSDIEATDIEDLLGTSESSTLEFKQEPWKDTKELAKDLASMANGEGGDVVLGIIERDGQAAALKGIDSSKVDREIVRIHQAAEANIVPHLSGLQCRAVHAVSGAAIVVRVSRSWLSRPHAVRVGDGVFRFFRRRDRHAQPMELDEVRGMFLGTDELPAKVRGFRQERVQKFLTAPADAAPVSIPDQRLLLLHVIPSNAFAPGFSADVRLFAGAQVPMLGNMEAMFRYTIDGYVRYVSQLSRYVEVRRNMVIEAVLGGSAWSRTRDTGVVADLVFDTELFREVKASLAAYLQLIRTHGGEAPLFILASLLRVRGTVMATEIPPWHTGDDNTINRDVLLYPEQVLTSFDADLDGLVDDLRRLTWQAWGHADVPSAGGRHG